MASVVLALARGVTWQISRQVAAFELAATGHFDQGVEMARSAAAIASGANQTVLANQIHERLRMYNQRQPYYQNVDVTRNK